MPSKTSAERFGRVSAGWQNTHRRQGRVIATTCWYLQDGAQGTSRELKVVCTRIGDDCSALMALGILNAGHEQRPLILVLLIRRHVISCDPELDQVLRHIQGHLAERGEERKAQQDIPADSCL